MDSNKDEALRCIQVAEKYIREKNKEKSEKFLHKAERLFPTQRAKGKTLFGEYTFYYIYERHKQYSWLIFTCHSVYIEVNFIFI